MPRKANTQVGKRTNPKKRKGSLYYTKRKQVARIAQKVVDRNTENNHIIHEFQLSLRQLCNLQTTLVDNYIVCSPNNYISDLNPARGTNSEDMQGNVINIKNATLSFVITPEAYNATTNVGVLPQNVIMYLFQTRINPNEPLNINDFCNQALTNGTFFKGKTSSPNPNQGFRGDLLDYLQVVNDNRFKLLMTKTFKIGYSQADNSAWGIQGAGSVGRVLSNDYKLNAIKKINITKYLYKKYVKDDDGNWTTPYLFCLWQTIDANGTVATTTQRPIAVEGRVEIVFQD